MGLLRVRVGSSERLRRQLNEKRGWEPAGGPRRDPPPQRGEQVKTRQWRLVKKTTKLGNTGLEKLDTKWCGGVGVVCVKTQTKNKPGGAGAARRASRCSNLLHVGHGCTLPSSTPTPWVNYRTLFLPLPLGLGDLRPPAGACQGKKEAGLEQHN